MKNTPEEQHLLLSDYSNLLESALKWLKDNRTGVIHTNRYIHTSWSKDKFDYTVSDEHFTRLMKVLPIRNKNDIVRLEDYLKKKLISFH